MHDEETESTKKSSVQPQARECVGSTEAGQAHGKFVSPHSNFPASIHPLIEKTPMIVSMLLLLYSSVLNKK